VTNQNEVSSVPSLYLFLSYLLKKGVSEKRKRGYDLSPIKAKCHWGLDSPSDY
jgi:hypothetical protein